jgi:hypothetical protein
MTLLPLSVLCRGNEILLSYDKENKWKIRTPIDGETLAHSASLAQACEDAWTKLMGG